MSEVVLKHLRAEGMEIREGALVERVAGGARLIDVHISEGGCAGHRPGHASAGRDRAHAPNVASLNLEAASIKYDKRGIQVSKGLVTSNSRVFAIGDVDRRPAVHARRQLSRRHRHPPGPVSPAGDSRRRYHSLGRHSPIPSSPTWASPRTWRGSAAARVRVFRWPYHENDRAQTERAAEGFVKVVTDAKGRSWAPASSASMPAS